MMENAIAPDMVGPITEETLVGLFRFVPPDLRLGFPNATNEFLEVRIGPVQGMEKSKHTKW